MEQSVQQVDLAPSRARLVYLDRFRALAILLIILGHCYNNWRPEGALAGLLVNTVTGGTALFVFISGVFFHHVFAERFELSRFLARKARQVLLPYLAMSMLALLTLVLRDGWIPFPLDIGLGGPSLSLVNAVLNLLTGQTMTAYWFVPFIFAIFVLSPVFLAFADLDLRRQLALLGAAVLLSMVAHRSTLNLNPASSVIYFAPFYLLGILYSQHRARAEEALAENLPLLVLTAVTLALLMVGFGQWGNAHKATIWQWAGLDLMVLQKVAMIGAMIGLLLRWEEIDLPVLGFLAEISFALFFLHPWAIALWKEIGFRGWEHGLAGTLLLFVLVVLTSVAAALTARAMLGHRSRFFTAW